MIPAIYRGFEEPFLIFFLTLADNGRYESFGWKQESVRVISTLFLFVFQEDILIGICAEEKFHKRTEVFLFINFQYEDLKKWENVQKNHCG